MPLGISVNGVWSLSAPSLSVEEGVTSSERSSPKTVSEAEGQRTNPLKARGTRTASSSSGATTVSVFALSSYASDT